MDLNARQIANTSGSMSINHKQAGSVRKLLRQNLGAKRISYLSHQ
jgi:hypothetical protein